MTESGGLVLGLIVEGHGEAAAAPVLIRRIALDNGFYSNLRFKTWRVGKSQILQSGELERTIEALTRQIGRRQPVLLLLDADDDCPVDLANELRARCEARHADVTVAVVAARREYEAWFLAAAKSIAGRGGLLPALDRPSEPESIGGAKEWLSSHMTTGQCYSPTRHQTVFSAAIDLTQARTARSFRKLEKEVARLIGWPVRHVD